MTVRPQAKLKLAALLALQLKTGITQKHLKEYEDPFDGINDLFLGVDHLNNVGALGGARLIFDVAHPEILTFNSLSEVMRPKKKSGFDKFCELSDYRREEIGAKHAAGEMDTVFCVHYNPAMTVLYLSLEDSLNEMKELGVPHVVIPGKPWSDYAICALPSLAEALLVGRSGQ